MTVDMEPHEQRSQVSRDLCYIWRGSSFGEVILSWCQYFTTVLQVLWCQYLGVPGGHEVRCYDEDVDDILLNDEMESQWRMLFEDNYKVIDDYK